MFPACISYDAWKELLAFQVLRLLVVIMLTHTTLSVVVMILWCAVTLTCLINTVRELLICISFLSRIGVFYGGTVLELLILLHAYVPISKTYFFYCFVLLLYWAALCNHNHRQFMLNLLYDTLTCFFCDPSVCSRSWGPVSSVPAHCELPALVLYPAFLWRAAARSHHLCGILHSEPPRQPGKPAWSCTNSAEIK